MASVLTFPQVTDQLLAEVVRCILTIGSPRKILLVGSPAKSNACPDSDLDLLIIEESDLPRYRRMLCGVFPAKDIVV
jgi:predicted nucleotidyltransferase